MAAIGLGEGRRLDHGDLYEKIEMQLPAYARPVFVRMQRHVEKTSKSLIF